MKVVSTGKEYRIYSDHLKVYDQLPAGVFSVRFSKMSGFFLEEHSDIEVHEEKIYGVHLNKINKVLKAFDRFERNLGVILSGDKGIGKSLFAKVLSKEAIAKGLPIIVVDEFIPGINSFIEEIEQEVVVLFDEFDKTFAAARNSDSNSNTAQTSLLSLLDGIAAGKKLYVITCNSFQGLNDYLINRPGRFHYHFRFDYPSAEEIKVYLRDKINEEFYGEIDKVVAFAGKINLNYDCLRAIAYELQNGETFANAITDLNIMNLADQKYNITVNFVEGPSMYVRNQRMDLFDAEGTVGFWLSDAKGMRTDLHVEFSPSTATYDAMKAVSTIDGENVELYFDKDDIKEEDLPKMEALKVKSIVISRMEMSKYHYAV